MTLPNFVALSRARLLVCLQELQAAGTLARVLDAPPTSALHPADYPCAYVMVGELLTPIPSGQAGSVKVSRTYTIRIEARPLQNSADTSLTSGSDAYKAAANTIDPVTNYLAEHPRLQTDAAPTVALEYIADDISFQDAGVSSNEEAFIVDFNIVITQRGQVSRPA